MNNLNEEYPHVDQDDSVCYDPEKPVEPVKYEIVSTTGNPDACHVAKFTDPYGKRCSIQGSSAVKPAIWFGVDIDANGQEVCQRVNLTRNMVAGLLPILEHFVETGELPKPSKKND